MEETLKNSDPSDSLYYADQLGSVEQQIEFLDGLNFSYPRLIVNPDGSECFLFIKSVPSSSHHRFFEHISCKLLPSLSGYPRSFHGPKVLDLRWYLEDRIGLPTQELNYFV